MNKVVLASAALTLLIFGSLFYLRNDGRKILYVPQNLNSSQQSIYLEPPLVTQIQQDLSGKTVVIDGHNHQFMGPELTNMSVLNSHVVSDNNLEVDVQICANSTIVNRKGLRRSYTHENVCGSLKVYYERKNGKWSYRMAENIDLQKVLYPKSR